MTQSGADVTAVIPLLFLVVTQISSAGREMDLVSVAGNHTPFVFSFLSESFFPQMGRFNFVHGMNTVVLFTAVVTSAGLSTGLQRVLVVFVSITLWVVTPALEVDEYDQILENLSEIGGEPHSFQIHVVCVLPYGFGVAVVSGWHLGSSVGEVSLLRTLSLVVALFAPVAVYYIVYMNRLQAELEAFREPPIDASRD